MPGGFAEPEDAIDAILRDFERMPSEALQNLETFARMMAEAGYYAGARRALEVILCAQAGAKGAGHPEALRTRGELESLGVTRRELYEGMIALGERFRASGPAPLARGAADVARALGLLEQIRERAADERG